MKVRHWFKGSVFAAGTLAAGMASAELVLLEQFDYEGTDQPLNGLDGGDGFAEPWVVGGWSRNYDIGRTQFAPGPGTTVNDRGGLEFEGLPTAGSALARFGTAGQREAHRELSAAAKAALTQDNTTIWFSALIGAPTGPHKYGTLIFGTDPLLAVQGAGDNANLSSPTGQAFGVGLRTDNGGLAGPGSGSPNAVAFIDSASATVEVGTYVPPLAAGETHHETVLVVGKINWNANGTEDELFLFNISSVSDPVPAEGDAVASLTADFDQSNFDVIGLQDTGSTIYDEIRFGTTFESVLGLVAADPFELLIRSNGANLDIEWESKAGMFYVLWTSVDLAAELATWESVNVPGSVDNNGVFEIASNAPLNMHSIARPGDPLRFYRVQEFVVPPPPPIFAEDFDSEVGPALPAGWSTSATGTAWELGDPTGGSFTGPSAAKSGPNCVGTAISTEHAPATDYSLITPVIAVPASGATLNFEQFIDSDEDGDVGTIRILDADNADALIEELNPPGSIEGISAGWSAESFALPAAANGANIRIEFRFVSNENGQEFAGFYIDDVSVEAN